MTGELIGIPAACALAITIGGVLLLVGRIVWWALTNRRRHEEAHCE